mgnify:CR=1 FL=1
MKRKVQITTGAYDEPYVTDCIYDESESRLVIKWAQQHEGDSQKSAYGITFDKESGVAVITRKGEVDSELVFDTGKKTKGVVKTPYGAIQVDIITDYITVPSVLSQKFEICYDMAQGGGSLIKNTFSLNFHLQNL